MDYSILTTKNILVILMLSGFCYLSLKNSFFIGNFLGFIDLPNKRKIHKENIPNFGGLLFIISSSIIFLYVYLSNQLNIAIKDLIYINVALISMFFVGYYDDIKNISPYKRVFFFLLFCQ